MTNIGKKRENIFSRVAFYPHFPIRVSRSERRGDFHCRADPSRSHLRSPSRGAAQWEHWLATGRRVVCGRAVVFPCRRPRSAAATAAAARLSERLFLLHTKKSHAHFQRGKLVIRMLSHTVPHKVCCYHCVKFHNWTSEILKPFFPPTFYPTGGAVTHDAQGSNFPQISLSGKLPLFR